MILILYSEVFTKITSKTGLVHVDVNLGTSKTPREVDTEKLFNDTHAVDHQKTREDALEF